MDEAAADVVRRRPRLRGHLLGCGCFGWSRLLRLNNLNRKQARFVEDCALRKAAPVGSASPCGRLDTLSRRPHAHMRAQTRTAQHTPRTHTTNRSATDRASARTEQGAHVISLEYDRVVDVIASVVGVLALAAPPAAAAPTATPALRGSSGGGTGSSSRASSRRSRGPARNNCRLRAGRATAGAFGSDCTPRRLRAGRRAPGRRHRRAGLHRVGRSLRAVAACSRGLVRAGNARSGTSLEHRKLPRRCALVRAGCGMGGIFRCSGGSVACIWTSVGSSGRIIRAIRRFLLGNDSGAGREAPMEVVPGSGGQRNNPPVHINELPGKSTDGSVPAGNGVRVGWSAALERAERSDLTGDCSVPAGIGPAGRDHVGIPVPGLARNAFK
jgi:hypothetical protein